MDEVRRLGMQLGLWGEPEMVNPDSDLARAYPDWILATGGRMPPLSRSQHVLDLAHPEAYAYILERLDALLAEYPISYLKWDHNRDLLDAGHGPLGTPGVHAPTRAVYRLIDELRDRHPDVEIESCSSGGLRVDLEILDQVALQPPGDSPAVRQRQPPDWLARGVELPGRTLAEAGLRAPALNPEQMLLLRVQEVGGAVAAVAPVPAAGREARSASDVRGGGRVARRRRAR